jgi:multidrug transporter EmrE-like cation transporter
VPTISPPVLAAMAILATALAQILLKRAAVYDLKTTGWFLFMGMSAGFYAMSFIAYSQMLRFYPLNKAYPLTTVAQILLVTAYGFAIGEAIGLRHALGLVLGVAAIYLILS